MAEMRALPGPAATRHCETCDDTRVIPQGVDVDACPICARLAEAAYQDAIDPARARFLLLDAVAQDRRNTTMRRSKISKPTQNRRGAA